MWEGRAENAEDDGILSIISDGKWYIFEADCSIEIKMEGLEAFVFSTP
jgi:hypothetical protein